MMWVAAFAVSVYGSCQARAGHKPFNPLLGETFECVREDRGFRYVAEQVTGYKYIRIEPDLVDANSKDVSFNSF